MLRQGPATLQLVVSSLSAGEQQRGFATLKDISIRLKSVKNIQKITKSMKMVAAAKYAKAERDLKVQIMSFTFQKGNVCCFSLSRERWQCKEILYIPLKNSFSNMLFPSVSSSRAFLWWIHAKNIESN